MTEIRIARVFPRRTRATPTDDLAFTSSPGLFPPDVDEVHVSVIFTWDIPKAEQLARDWIGIAPVKIGGPAIGMRGENYVSGRYLKPGYTITSRGCPNHCWFCSVPKLDGGIRELPIIEGFDVLDDNLLACSDDHVRAVFKMLSSQPQRPRFTGGLEPARLTIAHAHQLRHLHAETFFAYDTPDDLPALKRAAELLHDAGFKGTLRGYNVGCYVLIGYPKDSFSFAESRLKQVVSLGIMPMAMLWRDQSGKVTPEWRSFQRKWVRPHLIYGRKP